MEVQSLFQLEVYDFLFYVGFSIKDIVDDFVGRGVGFDVVCISLIDICGVINIEFIVGKGIIFIICLFFILSICKVFCCLSDWVCIVFFMDGVEDIRDYLFKDIVIDEDG